MRLFIGGEVTSRQLLLCEANLPMLEGIFVAAAYQEREMIAKRLKRPAKSSWPPCSL